MSLELRRPGIGASIFSLLVVSLAVGLGVWQLRRLEWKTDLLHRIAALQSAPAEPLGAVLRRLHDHVDIDFTRVELGCPGVETSPALRLYAVVQGLAGYRLVTACPAPAGSGFGSILVDRGFIAMSGAQAPPVPPGQPIGRPVVGILRIPDGPTIATPKNQPVENLWYWRDVPAMAEALHASSPAPAVLMLETPAPADMIPRPAPLPVNIPNNHLQYAITWFALAVVMACVYLASLIRKRP